MIRNVLRFVHSLLEETVTKDDCTIDATCGNGNDTLKLALLSKHVYAFDVQEQAINNTNKLLEKENISNVSLIHDSHENFKNHIRDNVKAITYNLGYLPGSDKSIITTESSTLESIKQGLLMLSKKGIICITLYIGHTGGDTEAKAVEHYLKSLPKDQFQVIKYQFLNRDNAPFVIIVEKQK